MIPQSRQRPRSKHDMNTHNEASALAMSPNPFLATLQTTALKELSKFTGDHSQKVTQFITAVEQIGAFTRLDSPMLHSIAIIKRGGSALNWYENNKDSLHDWPSLRTHLLERFKPSSSALKTQLKARRQQPGETLLTFYDDIIDLCQQVDSNMPLHLIIDFLQDGVRDDLKIHIKRRLRTLPDPITPAAFLRIARDEEELQKESFSNTASSSFTQPYFPQINATTRTSSSTSPRFARFESPAVQSSSFTPHPSRTRFSAAAQSFRPCLICHKSNHRTIDCYQKKSTGCFKCGDSQHTVRNCPQVFQ